jgi:hypothetical protein
MHMEIDGGFGATDNTVEPAALQLGRYVAARIRPRQRSRLRDRKTKTRRLDKGKSVPVIGPTSMHRGLSGAKGSLGPSWRHRIAAPKPRPPMKDRSTLSGSPE